MGEGGGKRGTRPIFDRLSKIRAAQNYSIQFKLVLLGCAFVVALPFPSSDFLFAKKCQTIMRPTFTSLLDAVRHSFLTIPKFHLSLLLSWDAVCCWSSFHWIRLLLITQFIQFIHFIQIFSSSEQITTYGYLLNALASSFYLRDLHYSAENVN